MRLLSIGDRIENGGYDLHSRFDRVVNFTDGRRLVSLVESSIGAGPFHLVVEDHVPRQASRLTVDSGVYRTDQEVLEASSAKRFNSLIPFGSACPDGLALRLDEMEKRLVEAAGAKSLAFLLDESREKSFRSSLEHGFVECIKQGTKELFQGERESGVRLLKGCGFGLTPSGDDYLSGVLLALRAWQSWTDAVSETDIQQLYDTALGEQLISNAFLQMAFEGRAMESVRSLAQAVFFEGEKTIPAAVGKLCSLGESSGADWGTGFLMALRNGMDGKPAASS
ncbi:MAG: DUF2877 domain-containing protein [Lentisphaerota bacterium]